MHKITTLLLFFACCIFASTANDNIVFNHLGFEAGLSEININGLYQDEKGILWIGTKDGVKKYDGNNFESIRFAGMNNWGSTAFPTVCGDMKGHVYISVEDNIVEYNIQNDTYKTIYTSKIDENSNIFCFTYGLKNLWIAFQNTIFSYRDGRKKVYAVLNEKQENISAIHETTAGELLLGTKGGELFSINPPNKITKLLSTISEVISIYEDSKHNIWVGTFSKGLFCILSKGGILNYTYGSNKAINLSSNYVRAICEDNKGNIWVGTMLGVDKLNITANSVTHYGLSGNGKSGLTNLSVWVIIKDNQGTIWFGTFYGGLNYYNPKSVSFNYNDFGTHYSGNGYPIIGQIQQDKRGNFWMCTEGKGLLFMNKKNNAYRFILQTKNGLSSNNLKSLYYDAKKDKLWIGTHLGGLCCLDINTMKFKQYDIQKSSGSTKSEIVHALAKYKNTLFIGTLMGVYQMDLQTEIISKVNALEKSVFTVSGLLIDRKNNLWIAGNNLYNYNIPNNTVKDYKQDLYKITSTSENLTTTLFENKNGKIIIAASSYGFLIYDPEKNTFKDYYNLNKELVNSYISSIEETSNGILLAGSNIGFFYIDIKNKKCYRYNSQNGFPLFSMSPGCIFKTSNGEFVLSGVNGVASINENTLHTQNSPFKLNFSKLWVNNTLVIPGDKTGILDQNLNYIKKLVLDYNQNAISIEIGNDNYANLGHAVYQYKLLGFEKEWIDFTPKMPIKYMNLPYGHYTLNIRAKYEDGGKSPQLMMGIKVKPPFYLTWYAYLLYIIIALSISTWLINLSKARLMLQTSLTYEKRDKEQREKANQSKLRFFTNISHELRTPLTLIIGQLELLISNKSAKNVQSKLKEIHKSATDMSQLINELLDFQKHDQGMFKIHVSEYDMVKFIKDIYLSFKSYAELKDINFVFDASEDNILVWFDPIQLQKVFNNLLANAFKYTPKGGKIEIKITKTADYAFVSVVDNGIGISNEFKQKIFDQFFQIDNSINKDIFHTGTGIGLSLSKSIMNAHAGFLTVKSEENEGSAFTVQLLLGTAHFEHKRMIDIVLPEDVCNPVIQLEDPDKAFQAEVAEQMYKNTAAQPTILIVEDDDGLRKLLIQIFDPVSLVIEANNGIDAIKLVKEKSPDLILSDIMMPGMSGYELCTKIKSDFETCHVPIILLTALSSVDQTIEGINSGADDYIIKPFNVKLLITKCLSLVNNRRILQEKFSKQIEKTPLTIANNPLDQHFVEKIIKIIESNVENGEINVSQLCSEMAISRTILFSKMKGITGQTPHEFIQNIKLKLAARMIQESPEKNISEIADYFGFSSLNYFGKSFKEHFGVSPSSLRKAV